MASNLRRRTFLTGMGAAGAGASTGPQVLRANRPNVLLILVDQWSAAALDLSGPGGMLRTPAVNSIRAGGIQFANSYCAYPLCSPSRASLLTGQMPHDTGVNFNVPLEDPGALPKGMPTLGSLFAEAGYATGYFGKEHVGGALYRGFQDLGSLQFTAAGYLASGSVLDGLFVRDAIDFIGQPRRQPFLAVVSLINPHDIGYTLPGDPIPNKSAVEVCHAFVTHPGRYLRAQDFPPLPRNFGPHAPPLMSHPVLREAHKVQDAWTADQWRLYLATYLLLLENTDWLIGRLLAALRARRLERNTLVLFTADHGEQMAAHHLVGKFVFYEEAARVPLFLSWPGVIRPGEVNGSHLVSGVDILPTLCDYARTPVPEGLAGQSLRPLIEGRQTAWRQYLVSEIFDGRMVRTESHKYLRFQRDGTAEFFYDLHRDPGELRDLVFTRESAAELDRSRALLDAWMKQTGGTFERTRVRLSTLDKPEK